MRLMAAAPAIHPAVSQCGFVQPRDVPPLEGEIMGMVHKRIGKAQAETAMIDENLARLRAHRNNI